MFTIHPLAGRFDVLAQLMVLFFGEKFPGLAQRLRPLGAGDGPFCAGITLQGNEELVVQASAVTLGTPLEDLVDLIRTPADTQLDAFHLANVGQSRNESKVKASGLSSSAPFPLTPALSPGERENRAHLSF